MLIIIRDDNPRPIYQQIIDQVKEQIISGLLLPGDDLPSVRELAQQLQVNMHTVHRAYQELKNEGIVIMRLGQKVRIAKADCSAQRREEMLPNLRDAMRRLIVDAYHSGYSRKQLTELFQEQLNAIQHGNPDGKEI